MVDTLGPYLLGPNDTAENGIYTGDSRELAPVLPDIGKVFHRGMAVTGSAWRL